MNYTHEIIKIIFASVAMIYFVVQISFIKFWRNNVSAKLGSLVLKTSSPKVTKSILVLIFCPILIIFSLITKSTFFVCCLMSVVASLACFIACRELVYLKLNGIYENGIVGSGTFVAFNQIKTFPDTSWKEPDAENTTTLAIQLKNEKTGKPSVLFIDYPTILEYVKVVNAIKNLKQDK